MNEPTFERVEAQVVFRETKAAYTDVWSRESFEITSRLRNLDFLASAPVTKAEAVKIMKVCVPVSYNKFEAKLLEKLPEDVQIYLARENSPCIYVDGDHEAILAVAEQMLADEIDIERGMIRLWWD